MRLYRINIEGFGNRTQWDSGPLDPGINLIVGPNEAGKSTIFSFVRSVLYGFSPKNKKHPYFPRKGDVEFGGSLELIWNESSHTLERFLKGRGDDAILRNAEGQPVDYGESAGLYLTGVTQQVFTNVFSISLSELKDFDQKERTEISPYFLGLTERTGEQINPRKVLEEIYNSADEISKMDKSKRRKPRRLEILKQEWRDARDRLREQKDEAEKARQCLQELTEIGEQIANLRRQETALLEEQKSLAGRRRTIDAAQKVIALENELNAVRELLQFPIESASELERLVERKRAINDRLELAKTRLEKIGREIEATQLDEALLAQKERIETLTRQADTVQQNSLEERELADACKKHMERLAKDFQACGAQGGLKLLETLAANPELDNDAAEAIRKLRKADNEQRTLRQLIDDENGLEQRLLEAEEELQSLADRLPAEPDQIRAAADPSRLLELRQSLLEIQSLEREIETSEKAAKDHTERLRALEAELGAQEGRTNELGRQFKAWLAIGLALGIPGLALLGLALWGDVNWLPLGESWAPSDFIGGGGVLTVIGLLVLIPYAWTLRNKKQHTEERIQQVTQPFSDEAQKALHQNQERIAALKSKLEQTFVNAKKTAEDLGLAFPLAADAIELELNRARELNQARPDLGRIELTLQSVNRLKQELEALQRKHQEQQTAVKHLQEALQPVLAEWGLPPSLAPQQAADAIQRITQLACEYLNEKDREERLHSLQQKNEQFVQSVCDLCSILEQPQIDDVDEALKHLQTLHETLNREIESRQIKGEREREQTSVRNDLQAGQEETDRTEKELQELLQKAGCDSIELFRETLERARKARNTQELLEERRRDLSEFEDSEQILAHVKEQSLQPHSDESNPAIPLEKEAAVESELDETKREINRLAQVRGNLEQKLADYRERIDLAAADAVVISLKSQREDVAKSFDVLQSAHMLLDEAIARFRRNHQPSVFQNASRFFEIITGGKYRQIVAPLADDTKMDIEVIAQNGGGAWPVDRLSRGTQEQLYLSLRLALAQEITSNGEMTPLFFDDLLVNFDEIRLGACYDVLESLAKECQVFLFTCHQWQAEQVGNRLSHRRIELS